MSKAIREAQRYDAPHEYVEQSAHGCYVHVDDHTAIVEELRAQLAAAWNEYNAMCEQATVAKEQLAAVEREIVSLTEIARCETAFAMAARTRAEQIEAENQILRQKIKDLTFIIENPKP